MYAGGEKAYTTVAFLLALGEAMEWCPLALMYCRPKFVSECPFNSPVRAMDEFDCFMDAANRNGSMHSMHKRVLTGSDVLAVSVQQLIDCAKIQQHRQFLFLTPLSMTQSINALQGDPMVMIINLKSVSDA